MTAQLLLNDENFDHEINNSKLPVLVDFFAFWCEPCQILAPLLEKVLKEAEGKLILGKINVDESPLTTQKFGIEKIPTVILFDNGKPIAGFAGLMQIDALKDWLTKVLNKELFSDSKDQRANDELIRTEELINKYTDYAKENGFNLNPDRKIVERIAKGLLENEKKYGKKYCPCRIRSGNIEEDSKKICPCFWHKEEIAKDGKCFCGLFVK